MLLTARATHGRVELGHHTSRVSGAHRKQIESVATISFPLPSIFRKFSLKSRSLLAHPQRFR